MHNVLRLMSLATALNDSRSLRDGNLIRRIMSRIAYSNDFVCG
jgi:hypothetical protein